MERVALLLCTVQACLSVRAVLNYVSISVAGRLNGGGRAPSMRSQKKRFVDSTVD
jgi:hypothetical protein